MDALIVLLFFVPGLIVEFIREGILLPPYHPDKAVLARLLHGLWYNVPMTAFTWFVIWFWKVALNHDLSMIQSLADFWNRAINQNFLMKYSAVLLLGAALYALGFFLYKILRDRKRPRRPCQPE